MEKKYEMILSKLEEFNEYELVLSRIFNEIILGEKKINTIETEFSNLKDTYLEFWDMLYSLKINDDELDVIKKLFENIFLYENIKEMISELNAKKEIIDAIDTKLLQKNKHTENLLLYIFKNEGISHDSLAAKMGIKKDTLTHAIDSIRDYDLIYKVKDGRNNNYFLTKLGMKYYKIIEKASKKYCFENEKYYVEDDSVKDESTNFDFGPNSIINGSSANKTKGSLNC